MSTPTKVTQKCSVCGGDMVFNPSKEALVCKQCGNFTVVAGTVSTEKSFQALLNSAPSWQNGTAVFCCEHCGAKSVVSKTDLITRCEYCGASTMMKTAETPGMRPDTIVLFRLSPDEAKEKVHAWLKKQPLVPNAFRHQLEKRQLVGVYYPAFTFDANVLTKYTGIAVYTDTVSSTMNGETTTHHLNVRRQINGVDTHVFDDILVLADDKMTPAVFQQIQPFDCNVGQVFQQSYLAGFTVCSATKEPSICWEEAKSTMDGVIRDKINTKYGQNSTKVENLLLDKTITTVTYKHVLLPIYIGHTEYKGKKYPLYLNGQTGKIHGQTPKSGWKVFFTLAAMGLAAAGVGILVALFL